MGFLLRLRQLPYRALRRFATANRNLFFGLDLACLPRVHCPDGISISQWSEDDLRAHLAEEHPLDESHADWLRNERAVCYAAMQGDSLAGFAWIAFAEVPGEMNHAGHPDTRLALCLPDNTGFAFHVYILPAYRGKRLYVALMSHVARELPSRGVTKLILTTECTNQSALRSVRRMGFREVGQSWLIKVGPLSAAGYPDQPFFGEVRTGKYPGDKRNSSQGG